jgi:hypothetical protein
VNLTYPTLEMLVKSNIAVVPVLLVMPVREVAFPEFSPAKIAAPLMALPYLSLLVVTSMYFMTLEPAMVGYTSIECPA